MRQQTIFLPLLFAALFLAGCNNAKTTVGPNNSGKWTQVNGLPTFNNITTISGKLFAAGSSGVFRSTDNGVNWTLADSISPIGALSVTAVDGAILAGQGSEGVFFSTTNGSSWTHRDSGLATNSVGVYQTVNCFALSSSSIFAGTETGGVFRSIDNGTSWTSANNGIYSSSNIFTLAINGFHIFAGTVYGAYLSTDDGENWVPVDSGLVPNIYNPSQFPLVVSLATKGTDIFAGTSGAQIFLSTNYGTSWNNVTGKLPSYPESWIYLAASDSSIFVGYDAGVFASTNNGSSWTNMTDNLPNAVVGRIAVVGKDLYVSEVSTVWRLSL